MKARLEIIFGKSISDKLYEFEFDNEKFSFKGFISKEILSGSKYNKEKSIHYYFLNSRCISKIKKIDDIILSIYREFNKECNPIRIVHLQIKKGAFDINVGEFKNKFFIEDEAEIVSFFSKKLMIFHEEKLKLYWVNSINEANGNSNFKKNKINFSNSFVSEKIIERVNIKDNLEKNKKIDKAERGLDGIDEDGSFYYKNSIGENNNTLASNSNFEKIKRKRLTMENLFVYDFNDNFESETVIKNNKALSGTEDTPPGKVFKQSNETKIMYRTIEDPRFDEETVII